jgi:hypothetical protein
MMCDHVLQLLTTTVEEMEGVRSSLYNRFFSVGKDIVIGFLYELDVIFVIVFFSYYINYFLFDSLTIVQIIFIDIFLKNNKILVCKKLP